MPVQAVLGVPNPLRLAERAPREERQPEYVVDEQQGENHENAQAQDQRFAVAPRFPDK